jgi:hypothetical protein
LEFALRRDDTTALIAKAVPIIFDGDAGVGNEVVGNNQVSGTRRMDAQSENHRCLLRTAEDDVISDPKLHNALVYRPELTVIAFPDLLADSFRDNLIRPRSSVGPWLDKYRNGSSSER